MTNAPEHFDESAAPFERLDFVYMPSADVAKDVSYFTDVLGGRLMLRSRVWGRASR